MKNFIILFISILISNSICSQNNLNELFTRYDSLVEIYNKYSRFDSGKIGEVYAMPIEVKFKMDSIYESTKNLVGKLMFDCDSTLADKINKYAFLAEYIYEYRFSGFQDLYLSSKYCGLKGKSLIDSLYNDKSRLIFYAREFIDSAYLISKINNEIDLEKVRFLVSFYYNTGFESPAPEFILHRFSNNLDFYCSLFRIIQNRRSSYFATDSTLMLSEKIYFEENMNLNDSNVLYVYKHIILDIPTAEEIIYREEQRKEYLEFERLHLLMLDSLKKLHLYNDSLRLAHYYDTLSGPEKLEYLIWQDSTLAHGDGRMRTVAIADDGYRFDTLSNEALINRFQMLNFDSLMALKIKSPLEANSNVQMVYMHKITQVLGDRFLNRTLDANDPKLKQALDRFDEFVVRLYKGRNFEQLYLQTQIKECYLRLWLLIEPYMLARVDSCKRIFGLDCSIWHYMMDENRVKYLHDKAAEAIEQGDLEKAKCYIEPMAEFTINTNPILGALPPRRNTIRNIEISYDWYEKYHLPILEKLGLR